MQIVGTLSTGCCRSHLLNGWEQQPNQDGDDGNDDKQLNEREAFSPGFL